MLLPGSLVGFLKNRSSSVVTQSGLHLFSRRRGPALGRRGAVNTGQRWAGGGTGPFAAQLAAAAPLYFKTAEVNLMKRHERGLRRCSQLLQLSDS